MMEVFRFMTVRSPQAVPEDDITVHVHAGALTEKVAEAGMDITTELGSVTPSNLRKPDVHTPDHLVLELGQKEFQLAEAYAISALSGPKGTTKWLADTLQQSQAANLTRPIVVDDLSVLLAGLAGSDWERFRRPHFSPVGIGDLKVVRQRLKRYELGEIAHIENVLKSEKRVKDHRRLDRAEVFTEQETETETTEEQDLRTEERFELREEVQRQISEDESLQTGVSVSAQYGQVHVNTNLDYSSQTSKERSDQRSSQYAKELVERSLNRVQERVLNKRATRNLRETEITNRHVFDNTHAEADHIVGLYRYVNKVYEAQLLNKGKRVIFDFIVPEPARWLTSAENEVANEPEAVVGPAPQKPNVTLENVFLPSESDEEDYQDFAVLSLEHGVTEPPPPPEPHQFVNKSFKSMDQDKEEWTLFAETGEVEIPTGYEAVEARVTLTGQLDSNRRPTMLLAIGGMTYDVTLEADNNGKSLSELIKFKQESDANGEREVVRFTNGKAHSGRIGVTFIGAHDQVIAALIEVRCVPTEHAIRTWKQSVVAAIYAVYLQKLERYNSDLQAARAQARSDAFYEEPYAPHPAYLRETERTELKRRAIEILGRESQRRPDGSTESMTELVWFILPFGGVFTNEYAKPRPLVTDEAEDPYTEVDQFDTDILIDVTRLERQAAEIRFAEQAFEWADMTYIFYPYYWANPERWRGLSQRDHADATYRGFLRAGAARITVSVRPGHETAVHDFLATGGASLEGHVGPSLTDPTWLPLIKEIHQQQGYDPAKPEVLDCWEVTVPTNLVMIDTPDVSLPNNGESEACRDLTS